MCLGETIRVSTTLHSLRMEGASRLSEILPGKSQLINLLFKILIALKFLQLSSVPVIREVCN